MYCFCIEFLGYLDFYNCQYLWRYHPKKLKKDFDLQLLKKYESEVKQSYQKTIAAFIEGDKSSFPKANKDTKVHVRPKALRKDDSFMFTSGEMLTKRTFWVTRYYLNELLDEKR